MDRQVATRVSYTAALTFPGDMARSCVKVGFRRIGRFGRHDLKVRDTWREPTFFLASDYRCGSPQSLYLTARRPYLRTKPDQPAQQQTRLAGARAGCCEVLDIGASPLIELIAEVSVLGQLQFGVVGM